MGVTSRSKASPSPVRGQTLLNWLQNPSDATRLAANRGGGGGGGRGVEEGGVGGLAKGNDPVAFQHEKEREIIPRKVG